MNGKKLFGYVCIKMDVNKYIDYNIIYYYYFYFVEFICY